MAEIISNIIKMYSPVLDVDTFRLRSPHPCVHCAVYNWAACAYENVGLFKRAFTRLCRSTSHALSVA